MSPVPLGIWATAGAGGGAAPASYELITTAYGTGSSGVISFTSIPNTYKHLQIRYAARSAEATAGRLLYFQANSDTSSTYYSHQIYGNTGSITSTWVSTNVMSSIQEIIPGASDGAGVVGSGIIDVLDYTNTSKNKVFRFSMGRTSTINTGQYNIVYGSSVWTSTAAITTLDFKLPVNNFATITRFSLYGIKG